MQSSWLKLNVLFVVLWFVAASAWPQGTGVLTVQVGPPTAPPLQLVNHGDTWRYRKGTNEPPSAWQTLPDADLDNTWLSGPGGFGYGDNDDATTLPDMLNGYTTVYLRKTFTLPPSVDTNQHLKLVADFDDGFVAYLDGIEVVRTNVPGASGTPVPFNAIALTSREASAGVGGNPPVTFDLGLVGAQLQPGTHVLAIQGLNQARDSSDLTLIADLSLAAGQSSVVNGAFFSIVPTNTVQLSGSNTTSNSARVVVNGADATFNSAESTWSKTQPLAPGLNHLTIQALDAAGNVLASTNKDIIAELATTFVGGTLGTNSLWTGSLGIIRVTNDVLVPLDGTLAISDGAIVLLGGGFSIRATNATLVATGSANNAVHFFPADGTSIWGELIAAGTNASLTLKHVETLAGHIEVLDGATGLLEDSFLHDYLDGSTPILLTFAAASLTERRCHVANYFEQLIQVTPVHIEDCLCEHIMGDGIDFDGAPPGSSIRRCTLRHGNLGNVDAIDIGVEPGTPSRGVIIESCLIYDFPFDKGVSIGEAAENITVRNCVIYDCDSGVAVKDSSTAVLYQNTIVGCNDGFNLYQKNAGAGGGHATNTFNNILWGNANSINLSNNSTIVINYSDLAGTNWPGTGNLSLDPLFLDAAAHDYRLATNSPCIGDGLEGANMGALFPVGGVPVPPTNLVVMLNGTDAVLTWTDQSENETGFEIQRSLDGQVWTALARTDAGVTNFVDGAGQQGATNRYRLRATNVPGDSDFSNVAQVAVPLPPLRFEPATLAIDTNGVVHLRLSGPANRNYVIEVSPNLKDWSPVSTNHAPAGVVEFTDANALVLQPRFYRARLAPVTP